MKRRKRKNSRVFLISFAIVTAVLFATAGTFYYLSGQPIIRHLPDKIPTYSAGWASYAPVDAYQVTFRNYTAVRAYNSSAFSLGNLFQLASPLYSIPFSNIESLLTLSFSTPNATLDIAFVNRTTVLSLQQALEGKVAITAHEGNASLYFVQLVSNQQTGIGWMVTLASEGVIGFSEGGQSARTVIDLALGSRNGTVATALSLPDTNRMFYIVGGASSHLAFTIQNFPGIVTTGEKTLQDVDIQSSGARTAYVVQFSSTDDALSQFGYTKSVYFTANQYIVYDRYILVTRDWPVSSISAAVRQIG